MLSARPVSSSVTLAALNSDGAAESQRVGSGLVSLHHHRHRLLLKASYDDGSDEDLRRVRMDYRAALATAVSSGADFGLCTVLRIRMSGGNRFLPP